MESIGNTILDLDVWDTIKAEAAKWETGIVRWGVQAVRRKLIVARLVVHLFEEWMSV